MTKLIITAAVRWTKMEPSSYVKKQPRLNIQKSNPCIKCGISSTKGYLNVCSSKKTKYTTFVNTKDTLEDFLNQKGESQL